MILKKSILFFVGAGLLACSSVREVSVSADSVPVNNEVTEYNRIDSMIMPYRDSLQHEMNVVLSYAPKNFDKGRPNGSLNNWAADVTLNSMRTFIGDDPVFCLLNVGGLRNSINQGNVTVEDIYKVMPFDNAVVAVKMPISALTEIEQYISTSGGEPIAGARLDGGKLLILNEKDDAAYFWVVTSDYLMNGGDKMTFFEQRTDVIYHEDLLRDVMLKAAAEQDTLLWNNEIRIRL